MIPLWERRQLEVMPVPRELKTTGRQKGGQKQLARTLLGCRLSADRPDRLVGCRSVRIGLYGSREPDRG